jgi:hypothetical protein
MGYIGTDGTYNAGTPKLSQMVPAPTSVWKASDHDRQRQDHKGELLRPYLPNGDANPEFVLISLLNQMKNVRRSNNYGET